MSLSQFHPQIAAVAFPACAAVAMLLLGNRRRDASDVGHAVLVLAWTGALAVELWAWQDTDAELLRRTAAFAHCVCFLALMWFSTLADSVGERRRWRPSTLVLVAGSLGTTAWHIAFGTAVAADAWALLHAPGALAVYLRCCFQLHRAWVARPRAWLSTGLLGAVVLCYQAWLPPTAHVGAVLLNTAYLAWVVCDWIVGQRLARPRLQVNAYLNRLHDTPRTHGSVPETGGADPALQQALEEERHRIAQELHDSLGSHLVGLIALQDGSHPGQRATAAALEECLLELRIAVDTFHDDGASLVLSLARLRYRLQPSLDQMGIRMQWNVDDADAWAALPPSHARELLRIAQEALNNVMRHSGARRVAVTLCRRVREEMMVLEVRDDGRGLQPQQHTGKGLQNMRRRAEAVGARLEITGEPAYGTRVWVGYPL